jgi:RsiW-degrading membrane proteinase PrsW (M82 family)
VTNDDRWKDLENQPLRLVEPVPKDPEPSAEQPVGVLFGQPIKDPKVVEALKHIRTDQHIDGWNVRLYYWSRDARILAAVAFVILVISSLIAWQTRNTDPPTREEMGPSAEFQNEEDGYDLDEVLSASEPSPWKVYSALIYSASEADPAQRLTVIEKIEASGLDPVAKKVGIAFWNSILSEFPDANSNLLLLAHQMSPAPFANRLVAEFYISDGMWKEALYYVDREIAHHPSGKLSDLRLQLLIALGDTKRIEEEMAARSEEETGEKNTVAEPAQRLQAAIKSGKWQEVFPALIAYEAASIEKGNLLLALTAGLVWYAICAQAIQPRRLLSMRMLLPPFAVLAGALSTLPTLVASVWQEDAHGLRYGHTIVGDLIYFIGGVGVREEIFKLAFFLPFVPILLVRKSKLEMLVLPGFVGLGFAIWENMGYFAVGGPIAAFGRLLTANFFHIASTALIGFAFCEFVRSPIRKLLPFVATTLVVMLVHGIYDAFIGIPELQVLGIVSIVSFLLLSLFFFRRLKSFRDGMTDQISMAATLILGMAALTGCIFVFAAERMGIVLAAASLALSAFALVMISYLVYWQLGEGMSPEEEA